MPSISTLFISTALSVQIAMGQGILGPVYPPPRNLSSDSSLVRKSWDNLTATLDSFLTSDGKSKDKSSVGEAAAIAAAMIKNNTFSVGLFSLHDKDVESLQYHYTSSEIKKSTVGTKEVDGDSIYGVASVTKVITVLAGLLNLNESQWHTPLSDIFPAFAKKSSAELDPVRDVQWDKVTPWNLAAQLSGIQSDTDALGPGLLDTAIAKGALKPEDLGLPPINITDIASFPPCWQFTDAANCTADLYTSEAASHNPIFLPWTSPSYANNGFILLGPAISTLTGIPIDELVRKSIFGPLSMTSSSSAPPSKANLSRAVLAGNASISLQNPGIANASGGVWSTTNDLAKLGVAILNSTLLPADETRKWLKPTAHTAALQHSVGRPWEIYRYVHAASGVVTDVYTKSGDSGYASSFLVLVPDFDAGFSVLSASSSAERSDANAILGNLVTEALMPALMAQAAVEAESNLAGEFVDESKNSTLSLAVSKPDEKYPGFKIEKWVMRGVDLTDGSLVGNDAWRLVPTLISDAKGQGKLALRAYNVPKKPVPEQLFSYQIQSWFEITGSTHLGTSASLFMVDLEDCGKATGVTPAAWQLTLKRE